jgi:hypothetical protein
MPKRICDVTVRPLRGGVKVFGPEAVDDSLSSFVGWPDSVEWGGVRRYQAEDGVGRGNQWGAGRRGCGNKGGVTRGDRPPVIVSRGTGAETKP